jgi:hypothetical protein
MFNDILKERLPNFPMAGFGPATRQCTLAGHQDFMSVVRYVHALPYGRTSQRGNYSLVLIESKGTCSTKHALLASIAREHQVPIGLGMGIYPCKGENFPSVRRILDEYQLESIPESICFLQFEDEIIDVSSPVAVPNTADLPFFYTETIEPEQIDGYKPLIHKGFIADWARSIGLETTYTTSELWKIRERCMRAKEREFSLAMH